MRLALLIAVALALPVAAARAYVGPGATIVSASLEIREQGDDASTNADLSADGRYVVFDTRARNLYPSDFIDPPGQHYAGGVMRRDLQTGRVELVAPGDLVNEADGATVMRGARNPSVSADGRFVVFSTGQRLVPADVNGNIDVYVRDMATGAYELISARDGGSVPASYAARDPDTPLRNPGADVSPSVAISADGDRVLFRSVDVASDLPGHAAVDTPAYNLFVRVRSTQRTLLVTANQLTGAPAGGAPVGGALSADGTTAAWPGQNAGDQTHFLDGESPDSSFFYYLWRRVDSGVTRRITGPAEPEVQGCNSYDPRPGDVGPCTGPLSDREQSLAGITSTLPALSADGRRVLFVTGAPQRPPTPGFNTDLWLTDMHDGVSRTAGSVELTREGGRDPADSSGITAVSLSGDGRYAAVISERTRFLLPALRLTSDVTSVQGTDELYVIDLAAGTIERGLRGYNGANADGNVAPPLSISDGGGRIAFGSSADNLFYGDANQRADVFVVDRLDAAPPPPVDPDPPAEPAAEPFDAPEPAVEKLRVTVRRAPAGRIRLQVRVPAKGKLTVAVRGRVPDTDGRLRGPARLLGSTRKTIKKKSTLSIDVTLAKRYASVARRERKLDGRAEVTFTPASGKPLSGATAVRFAAPPKRR